MHCVHDSMVAAMLLLAFLSVACANSLSIKHWASHSPINKLHIFHLHGTNIALSVTNVHNDVDSTCKGWLHKLKQSVLPRVISLLIARSPCMPASARLIRAVAIPTREALTKDTHRQSTINTNTNKKVMRVSIDVAGDIQLQQQKRADQLTKLGFAVAAMCAAYGIRPGAGSKTIEPGAAAKHGANHNPQPATRFIIDSRGVDIEGEHLPRAALVDELHRQLTSSRFVHLDSAAATGKTSLFTLYSKSHPEVNVIYCKLHRRTSAYKQLRDVGVDQVGPDIPNLQ